MPGEAKSLLKGGKSWLGGGNGISGCPWSFAPLPLVAEGWNVAPFSPFLASCCMGALGKEGHHYHLGPDVELMAAAAVVLAWVISLVPGAGAEDATGGIPLQLPCLSQY